MSVRATSLAVSFAAVMAVGASAEERPGTSAPAARAFPLASEVRLGGDDSLTRMVVDFSRKLDIRPFTLANPYRVVIDMPQVTFQFPARTGETGRGLIKAFRYGLVMQGGSRMVIDLARPARIDKAFMIDAANDQPARLVLDLAASDRDSFMRAIALESRPPEPRKADAPAEGKPNGDPRPLVVIDPGHGGIDNGTRAASGELEKTIVLEFSLMLKDKIEKTGKYRVAMTRTDDTFVPLIERVQFARARQASLFVSIHVDALRRGEGDAQGATVYTLSERPSDAKAARLAEAENQADAIAGLDLSSELKDVAGHPDRSRPARNQDLLAAVRPVGDRPAQEVRPPAPVADAVGGVRGAQGSRRPLRAGRARLCHQQVRPAIAGLDRMAGSHRRFDRAGDRCVLLSPAGRR